MIWGYLQWGTYTPKISKIYFFRVFSYWDFTWNHPDVLMWWKHRHYLLFVFIVEQGIHELTIFFTFFSVVEKKNPECSVLALAKMNCENFELGYLQKVRANFQYSYLRLLEPAWQFNFLQHHAWNSRISRKNVGELSAVTWKFALDFNYERKFKFFSPQTHMISSRLRPSENPGGRFYPKTDQKVWLIESPESRWNITFPKPNLDIGASSSISSGSTTCCHCCRRRCRRCCYYCFWGC